MANIVFYSTQYIGKFLSFRILIMTLGYSTCLSELIFNFIIFSIWAIQMTPQQNFKCNRMRAQDLILRGKFATLLFIQFLLAWSVVVLCVDSIKFSLFAMFSNQFTLVVTAVTLYLLFAWIICDLIITFDCFLNDRCTSENWWTHSPLPCTAIWPSLIGSTAFPQKTRVSCDDSGAADDKHR